VSVRIMNCQPCNEHFVFKFKDAAEFVNDKVIKDVQIKHFCFFESHDTILNPLDKLDKKLK